MVFSNKKRCNCHKPRHKREEAILICDFILILMTVVFLFFLFYLIVLPGLGLEMDVSLIINVLYSGLWFVILLIVVNIGWAIYYGCQKSKAGVMLSMMTAMIMIYTYLSA